MKESSRKERLIMEKKNPIPSCQEWHDDHELPFSWSLLDGKTLFKRVLEIGCASGWISYLLQGQGADLVATDIFGTMVYPWLPFMIAYK